MGTLQGKRYLNKKIPENVIVALLLLFSTIAGVMYLRITLTTVLDGDDWVNNFWRWNQIQTLPFWQLLWEDLVSVFRALTFQEARFFPFRMPLPCIFWLFCGSITTYRLYIIAYTYVDIALAAWFCYKATNSRKLGITVYALMPMMFCLWFDRSINGMYSYEALPQNTLFWGFCAGLCMLCWQDSGKKRWAVLSALCCFFCCGTYELGYVYIAFIACIALMRSNSLLKALGAMAPMLTGEGIALFYNIVCRLVHHSSGNASVSFATGESFRLQRAVMVWLRQMSAAFPIHAILFGNVEVQTVTRGDVALSLIMAAIVLFALLWKKPDMTARQYGMMFLAGAFLLMFPAVLMALSAKYQNNGWITWTQGYLPSVAGAFGVGMMAATVFLAGFHFIEREKDLHWLKIPCSMLLLVALSASAVYNRAATRERYDNGELDRYNRFCWSLSSGIVDGVKETDWIVSSDFANQGMFHQYSGRELNVTDVQNWQEEKTAIEENAAIYSIKSYDNYGGDGLLWIGRANDADLATLDGMKVFVDSRIPSNAVLKYRVRMENGGEKECVIQLRDVEHENETEYGYIVTVTSENIINEKVMIWH